jgi:hypothetical protein
MSVNELEALILPDGRMDVESAACYLGVKRSTLGYWRSAGVGPPFIKPGKIYYFKKDLDAWLMRGGLVTTSAQARRQLPPQQRRKKAVAL